jgi:hypothetical protein
MKQSDPGKKQFCFLYAISGISVSMVGVYFVYSLFFLTPSFTALTQLCDSQITIHAISACYRMAAFRYGTTSFILFHIVVFTA